MSQRRRDMEGSAEAVAQREAGLEPVIGGKYRLESILGKGAFATVYRARHVDVRSLSYALKILRPAPSTDPSMRKRFRREAELVASLRSRHAVQVIDFGETEGGLPYLVMPFLEGASADQLLRRLGAFRPSDVAQIGLDVLDALQEAHELGIVHRDIKPSNLLLLPARGERHPICKVLDFGIAKIAVERGGSLVAMTAENGFLGTPAFSSPESLSGMPELRSDLYSLGHTLAELIEGESPYAAERTHALVIQQHLSLEPVPLGPKVRNSGLYQIIRIACEKRVQFRYQSAQEMRRAIVETGVADEERSPLAVVFTSDDDYDPDKATSLMDRLAAIGGGPAPGPDPSADLTDDMVANTDEFRMTPERGVARGLLDAVRQGDSSADAAGLATDIDDAAAWPAASTPGASTDEGVSGGRPSRPRWLVAVLLSAVVGAALFYYVGPTRNEGANEPAPAGETTSVAASGGLTAPPVEADSDAIAEATDPPSPALVVEPTPAAGEWHGQAVRSASRYVALAARASQDVGRRTAEERARAEETSTDSEGHGSAADTDDEDDERDRESARERRRERHERERAAARAASEAESEAAADDSTTAGDPEGVPGPGESSQEEDEDGPVERLEIDLRNPFE